MSKVCAQEAVDKAFSTGHLRQQEPSEQDGGTQRQKQSIEI